jgi:hypothetical protein
LRNDDTTGCEVGDSENKTVIDVNDEKTDSNDVKGCRKKTQSFRFFEMLFSILKKHF